MYIEKYNMYLLNLINPIKIYGKCADTSRSRAKIVSMSSHFSAINFLPGGARKLLTRVKSQR